MKSRLSLRLLIALGALISMPGCTTLLHWKLDHAKKVEEQAHTEIVGQLQKSTHAADLAAAVLPPSKQATTVQSFTVESANLSDTLAGHPLDVSEISSLKKEISRLNSENASIRAKAQSEHEKDQQRISGLTASYNAAVASVSKYKDDLIAAQSHVSWFTRIFDWIKWGLILLVVFYVLGLVLPFMAPFFPVLGTIGHFIASGFAPALSSALKTVGHGLGQARDALAPEAEKVVEYLDKKVPLFAQKQIAKASNVAPRS